MPNENGTKLYSLEMERSVIGSLLIDPDTIWDVAAFLSPTDFYSGAHSKLYAEMLKRSQEGRSFDVMSLGEAIPALGIEIKDQPMAWLIEMLNVPPSAGNIVTYAEAVRDVATRRSMQRAAQKMLALSQEMDTPINEVITNAERAFVSINGNRAVGSIRSPQEYISEEMKLIEARVKGEALPGISTGFADLDRAIGGFHKPFLYILAGRPGMGKSAMALNIAWNVAERQNVVLFFSQEMSMTQVVTRLLSSISTVSATSIRDGKLEGSATSLIERAASELRKTKLFIDASPGLTASEIISRSMQQKAKTGLDLMIVDHAHRMRMPDSGNRHQDLGAAARQLADGSKLLDCSTLLLSQLSRNVENRKDKRPQLSDLRESGTLEEEAHTVFGIYRDEYYNPDTTDRPNIAELGVLKNRDGYTAVIDLFWHANTTTFKNLKRQEIFL